MRPMHTPDPFAHVTDWLAALRLRLGRTVRSEAAWAATVALVTGAVAGIAAAAVLGPGPGRWAWIGLGLGLIAALRAAWVLSLRRQRQWQSDEALARWTERRVPGLASGVITTIQARATLAGEPLEWPGFSEPLARASADRTARRLDDVDPALLVDDSRARRMAPLGAAAVVLATALVVLTPELVELGLHNLVAPAPDAEIEEGVREVDVVVGDLAFRLIYPAYLDLQPRDIPRSSGDITAVAGTEVRLTGTALLEATAASLRLESDPERAWPLELSPEGIVQGALHVGESDRYRFELTEPGGGIVREEGWRSLEARADELPDVRLVLPEGDLEVNPTDQVQLLFEAVDDHGLDAIRLVLDHGTGVELQRKVVERVTGGRTARGTHSLSVASLAIEPGEHVDLWFEATDLNSISGPGVARSSTRRLSMYSPDAEHDERLAELERLIEQMIAVVAERLESNVDERDPVAVSTYHQVQGAISELTATLLTSLETLISETKTDPLATDALRGALQAAFDRLREHYEQEASQLRQMGTGLGLSRRQRALTSMLYEINEEGTASLELSIWELHDELEQARQDQLLAEGRDLLEDQNELMDLLEKLQHAPDEATRRAVDKKIQEMLARIEEMERQLRELAEESLYENQNVSPKPSDRRKEMMSLGDRMAEVKRLLAEGKVDEAMKLLEELSRSTQEMMAAMQDEFGPMDPQVAEARRKMSELQQRMGEAADGQRGVRDETRRFEQGMEEARERELLEERAADLAEARDKARQIGERLAEVEREPLHPADQEALDALRQKARELEESLDQPDIDAAREQAEDVAGSCDRLGGEVGQVESLELDPERSKSMKGSQASLEATERLAEELVEELEDLGQAQRRPPDAAEQGEARELEGLQKALKEGFGGIEESLEALEEHAPGISEELGPPLEEAEAAMGEAAKRLSEMKPGEARGFQEEAIERLQDAQQSMERRMKPGDRRGGQGGQGITNSEAEVAIPDEDDYRAPRAFREELLKAMKERAPERFERAIERYYEELVK